ncbi:glycosyl hydrolase family 28-related protein [Psychromonas ossibalaenae]|uniref:glycosyl hydrolase family 28-related protein n=1 Tax=Psychromonas ossibalaenae TaxID=444922 RepID=UPI00036B16ED|nr:glycosyl hydrolase family 28-related protein [Psychromonas ossibalaenae]
MRPPFNRFIIFFLILALSACVANREENSLLGDQLNNTDRDKQGSAAPSQTVYSSLWGKQGELWLPDSRLPFVALAGYGEGAALPSYTRIVANVVTDFGASPQKDSAANSRAFQNALTYAASLVSTDNPGVLYIPGGIYNLDKQLHLSTSGLVLRGAGRDKSVLRFTTGLVNDPDALGDDKKRRKLIVLGGGLDKKHSLKSGVNWRQWDPGYSASVDFSALPQRGDFILRLARPLKADLKENIINQNYRIRLAQPMGYGKNSDTPLLAAAVYGGSDFSPPGSTTGGSLVSQQFVVNICEDNQTLILDRPLRFSTSAEMRNGGARIAVRDIITSWDTEQIGLENLTIDLPETSWLKHFGTEGQGAVEIMSDNSWVRDVKIINADNGIEIDKNTFNNTIQNVLLKSSRTPRRSGPAGRRYDAYGHHGITLKGRDHLLKDFTLEVSFVHDITMNNCHGCVVTRGSAPQMNMDHHRQGIYDSVWTQLNLGNPERMWESTGNPAEGYNAGAYNTYWNIKSEQPGKTYWPEDGKNGLYPQWGQHKINLVATEIQRKPEAGEGNRPAPYHPDNAFLEVIKPSEISPQNIYQAQNQAYLNGMLKLKQIKARQKTTATCPD